MQSLKISNGYSEAVNRRRTDNTMAKRQTIQWPKDRQYNGQKTDNTMAKRKRTNTNLQNTTQKTEDRSTRTPLKQVVNPGVPER